ncbi:M20/M25/M40 family metallo-hydrolase [Macrococcoides canis]|uniref:M20/M25/M40 family metallo-hydrolase n=1 Tax=Macrococcoides canis TaxID=1855823 RepID=UPI0020B6C4C2|nr:M20/M25/M40 family metallo-hydrolase [Macrococcus canis]UTH07637.1 M20/M25/M40 family metallo-hydrolase [Macrococcus canis]
MTTLWQTPQDRIELLKVLVKNDSVTGSEGEQLFPYFLKQQLEQLDYFRNNESHIHLVETTDKKNAVCALYRSYATDDTIILMSHYDTVDVQDYGQMTSLAFDCDQLVEAFKQKALFNDEIEADLHSDEYMFGRGVMDMKSGLMMQMSILEKATLEHWPINIILVAVPDEEVGSSGMKAATIFLNEWIQSLQLKLSLIMNSEPSFSQLPGDKAHYVYTGSIGKLMPAVMVYGKETHVGEPLKGLSSNYIISRINQEIEYNAAFTESYKKETTPLPVSLKMHDLKQEYNVQTPFISSAYYNVFIFRQSAKAVLEQFEHIVRRTVSEIKRDLSHIIPDLPDINVITYQELLSQHKDTDIEQFISAQTDQEIAEQIVHGLLTTHHNNDYTVVVYFAPPYYPAVNSSDDKLVKQITKYAVKQMDKLYNRDLKKIHYFNGISDLSYVNYQSSLKDADFYMNQTPGYGRNYDIPFNDMQALSAPVINIGAFGKDPHQLSERIHIKSVSEEIPDIIEKVIKKFLCHQ